MEKGIQPLLPVEQGSGLADEERLLPLFSFGDLLVGELLEKLLQHRVSTEPARLIGYRIEQLAGLAWPVLVVSANDSVEGRIYRDLDAEDYRRIDAYAGVGEQLYHRIQATASVCDDRQAEPVYAYIPTTITTRRYG